MVSASNPWCRYTLSRSPDCPNVVTPRWTAGVLAAPARNASVWGRPSRIVTSGARLVDRRRRPCEPRAAEPGRPEGRWPPDLQRVDGDADDRAQAEDEVVDLAPGLGGGRCGRGRRHRVSHGVLRHRWTGFPEWFRGSRVASARGGAQHPCIDAVDVACFAHILRFLW